MKIHRGRGFASANTWLFHTIIFFSTTSLSIFSVLYTVVYNFVIETTTI